MLPVDLTAEVVSHINAKDEKYKVVDSLLKNAPPYTQNVIMKDTLLKGNKLDSDVLSVTKLALWHYWSPAIIKYIYSVAEKEYNTPILKFFDCVNSAISHGDKRMITYFIDNGIDDIDDESIDAAIIADQMSILHWIVKNKKFDKDCFGGIWQSVELGNFDAFKYLYDHGCEVDTDLVDLAAKLDRKDIMDYLEEIGVTYSISALSSIAKHGDLQRLVRVTNLIDHPHLIDQVASDGRLNDIKKLYDMGYRFTEEAFFNLAHNGPVNTFEFLYEKLTDIERDVLLDYYMPSFVKIMVNCCNINLILLLQQKLLSRREFWSAMRGNTDTPMDCAHDHAATTLDCIQTIDFLHAHRYRIRIPYLLTRAFERNDLELTKWIFEHFEIEEALKISLLYSSLDHQKFDFVEYLYDAEETYPEYISELLLLAKDHVKLSPSAKSNPVSFKLLKRVSARNNMDILHMIWDDGRLMDTLRNTPSWSELSLGTLKKFLQWAVDNGHDDAFKIFLFSPDKGLSYAIAAVAFKTNDINILHWLNRHEPDMDIIFYAEVFGEFIESLQLLRLVCRSIYKINPSYDFSVLEQVLTPRYLNDDVRLVLTEYLKRMAFLK